MSREVRILEPYFGQSFEPRLPRYRKLTKRDLDNIAAAYMPIAVERITHPLVPYVGYDIDTLTHGIGYRISDETLAAAIRTQVKPHIRPRDLMDILAKNNPGVPSLPRQAMDTIYDFMSQLLDAANVADRKETTLFVAKSMNAAFAIVSYRIEDTIEAPMDGFYVVCTDNAPETYTVVPTTYTPRVTSDYATQMLIPGQSVAVSGTVGAVPLLGFVLPVGTIVIVDRRYSPVSPNVEYDPYKP